MMNKLSAISLTFALSLLWLAGCQSAQVKVKKSSIEGIVKSIQASGDSVIFTIEKENGSLQGVTVEGKEKIRDEHGEWLALGNVKEGDKILVTFNYEKGETPKMLEDKQVSEVRVDAL